MPAKSKPKSKPSIKNPMKSIRPIKPTTKKALPAPRKWAKAHERFLIPELRRRQLPTLGSQSTLIARLKATDAPSLRSPESRQAVHEKRLKRLQTSALKNITTFPQFNKLPLEIREQIWEFSLPGPRVVTLDTSRDTPVPERLCFSRVFKARNPVLLSTCRESRAVAKRRYKLAFGTGNVYFDFEGGDILYFGPECFDGRILDQPWEWIPRPYWALHEREPRGEKVQLEEELRRDLEAVRHLAISRNLWMSQGYAHFGYKRQLVDNAHGDLLRKRLRKFKGVERISLEHGLERTNNPGGHELFWGTLLIEDPWFEERPFDWRTKATSREKLCVEMYKGHVPKIEEWLEMDGKWEITGDLNAVALLSRWDTKDLSEEEIKNGVPEARLVDIKFVADEPRRVREHIWRPHQRAVWR